jgi:hypothetical protein
MSLSNIDMVSAIYLILIHDESNYWTNLKKGLLKIRKKLILLGYELRHISNEMLYELILTAIELKTYIKVTLVQADLVMNKAKSQKLNYNFV